MSKKFLGKKKMTAILNNYLPEGVTAKMKYCYYCEHLNDGETISYETPDWMAEYTIRSRNNGKDFTFESRTKVIEEGNWWPTVTVENYPIFPLMTEEEKNAVVEWAKKMSEIYEKIQDKNAEYWASKNAKPLDEMLVETSENCNTISNSEEKTEDDKKIYAILQEK